MKMRRATDHEMVKAVIRIYFNSFFAVIDTVLLLFRLLASLESVCHGLALLMFVHCSKLGTSEWKELIVAMKQFK